MADENKPATGQVPVQAKDSGQTQPPNAAAKDAVQASEPGQPVTAADQSGDKKAIKAEEAPKAGTYVLKEGKTHSAIVEGQRRDLAAGDTIELTAEQAASFGDKFERKGK